MEGGGPAVADVASTPLWIGDRIGYAVRSDLAGAYGKRCRRRPFSRPRAGLEFGQFMGTHGENR